MPLKVSDLLAKLTLDPWRESNPFSIDMAEANKCISEAGENREVISGVLREWLQKYQPCLFGRIAARHDRISYCVLTEADLRQSDEAIRTKIQDARMQWTRDGFAGRSSGFIVLAAAPTIATAVPDRNLRALAQQLCSLYLLQQVGADRIYHDEIFLEKNGADRSTWQWLAGVNYFCANGDGRWWQDHRIPGGLAFSVNSVGHLVKTGAIAREEMDDRDRTLGMPAQTDVATKIDSLGKALVFAMRTISKASEAPSGRATDLLILPTGDRSALSCPIELPSILAGKDCRYYRSYYHTDFTLPSEYFLPDVYRPKHCKARTMELTYLIDSAFDDPDYIRMGTGRKIRNSSTKAAKYMPSSQLIAASERLVRALSTK